MQITATQKFIRMSPRKLRLVVGMIKGLSPERAVEILPYVNKRAADPLQKVIKTALANAKQQGVNADSKLVFESIQIGQGPRMKRWRPGSRGRIKPYTRDLSHIRVVLKEIETKKEAKNNGTKN